MKKLFQAVIFLLSANLYGQSSIREYLDSARQNSPLLNENRNLVQANKLEIERLKAFYTKPQIGITANYLLAPIISNTNGHRSLELNSKGANDYIGYDLGTSNGGQYQALLNMTQPLFNGKRADVLSEQTNVLSRVAENNNALVAHDLEKVVTDQYILCLQDLEQLDYSASMKGILEKQQEILQKLVNNNIYKKSDLILLSIEYQNAVLQQATWKVSYRRDLMDLKVLCGISDTTVTKLESLNLSMSGDVASSGFATKYQLDSLNLVAARKTFELKYRPQLNLFANTGLNTNYAPTIPKRFGMSAGLSFIYNFYDGHQKRINREKTDILLQSVSFNEANFYDQNRVRKSKLLAEIGTFTDRIAITEQQMANYDALMETYKREILSGQLSILNYTTTLKNTMALQRDFALLKAQKLLLINAYNYWNW